MLAWLLNLTYLGLLALVSPWLVYRSVALGKYRRGWSQKLWGAVAPRTGDGPCLWLHAVSVGEVVQLAPLVEGLSRHQPDLEIVVSVTTATGYDVAVKRFPRCRVIYFPLDFSWATRRALDRIRPTAVALVELELWPNFVFAAADRQIPVVLVNGRISERSYRGYRRIEPIARAMLARLRRILVQNEAYAERLTKLGAPHERITVTGSIKFDGIETNRDNPRTNELRRLFGLLPGEKVFIAGSTQAPEEKFAIEAWLAARKRHGDVRLILVPRHQERFDEVAQLVEAENRLLLIRRSRLAGGSSQQLSAPPARADDAGKGGIAGKGGLPPVLLLDTLGELSSCWGLADIAFVGGSLTQRGGQNMIEPAGYGAAVLFGPNTWNFKDVVELLTGQQAAVVVRDEAGLTIQLERFLGDRDGAEQMGRRAQALVARQRGATERTLNLILSTLAESRQALAQRRRAA